MPAMIKPEDEIAIIATLAAGRSARKLGGRDAKSEIERRIAAYWKRGEVEVARALEAHEDRRSLAFARRRARAAKIEAERFWAPMRVRIDPENRPKFRKTCPNNLFSRVEYGTGGVGTARHESIVREVFLQWTGRGLKSGRTWAGKRSSGSTRSSRNRPWKRGEAGRTVRYIEREAALEAGIEAILSNVGETIEERVAYFRMIEEVEAPARADASVYHHAIIALPYETVPSSREAIVRGIVEPLDKLGLGYVAAIHAPDADGDQRNHHLHIILSLRPMKRLGDYDWELAQSKHPWLDTPAGLILMRRHIAHEINLGLASEGSAVRWTALSRAERGLEPGGNTKRGPGDRHEKAAQAAERKLAAARRRADTIERIAGAVETLAEVIASVSDHKQRLRALTGQAAQRIRDLHDRLLAIASEAERRRRKVEQMRQAALARLKAMQSSSFELVERTVALRTRVEANMETAARQPAPIQPAKQRVSALERLQQLREAARAIYPPTNAARHPDVRLFLADLRNVAPPASLADRAMRLSKQPGAVAEIETLGPRVAEAYADALRQMSKPVGPDPLHPARGSDLGR